jgi:hypothetical protein
VLFRSVDNFEWAQVTSYPHFVKLPKGVYSVRAMVTEVSADVGSHISVLSLETPSISFVTK